LGEGHEDEGDIEGSSDSPGLSLKTHDRAALFVRSNTIAAFVNFFFLLSDGCMANSGMNLVTNASSTSSVCCNTQRSGYILKSFHWIRPSTSSIAHLENFWFEVQTGMLFMMKAILADTRGVDHELRMSATIASPANAAYRETTRR
jgi:hypothetical protein